MIKKKTEKNSKSQIEGSEVRRENLKNLKNQDFNLSIYQNLNLSNLSI